MQKKFITNLGLLLFLNIFIKVFWLFGIEVGVQNAVGTEIYGNFFAIFNFAFILNILLDLGITNFNNRNISRNEQLLSKHFSSILIIRLILAVIYTIVCIIIGYFLKYTQQELFYLSLIVANQFLASLILYFRSNLQALQLFKTDSIISVLDRIIMIAICGTLLWTNITDNEFKIDWFIYAQTVAYAIAAIITFFAVVRKTTFLKLNINKPFIIMILKKSRPFALLLFLMAMYNRVDPVLLKEILEEPIGDIQAGLYAQAYRILDAFNMYPYLFSVILLPMFSRMIKQKKSLDELVQLSFSLVMAPALILAVSVFFFQTDIMKLVYPEHYEEDSAKILGALMMSFLSICTIYIFGTLLTANKNLKLLNYTAGGAIIVNIIINFILIPKYLAYGSAIASLSTQFVSAIIQILIATYIFKFKINYKYIAQFIVFVGGLIALGYYSTKLEYTWQINMGLLIATSVLWSFITRVINVKGIFRILKYEDE